MERYRLRPHEIDVVRYTQEMHDRLLAIEWPENGVFKIDPGLVGGVDNMLWDSRESVSMLELSGGEYAQEIGGYIVRGEITKGTWFPMNPENLEKMYEPVHTDTAVEPV